MQTGSLNAQFLSRAFMQINGLRNFILQKKLYHRMPNDGVQRATFRFSKAKKTNERKFLPSVQTKISDEIPRITVPYHVSKLAEKKKKKLVTKKIPVKPTNWNKPLLISCARPEFNFRVGDTFDSFNPKLASKGWKARTSKSRMDNFTINALGSNPAIQREDKDISTFEDCGIDKKFNDILTKSGYNLPTHIQRLAMPVLLDGRNMICAADTGSGKTLAYLLPIMQMIQEQKEYDQSLASNEQLPRKFSPMAVIALPTKELVKQVQQVADQFYEDFGIISQSITGGTGYGKPQIFQKYSKVDVLISTPKILKTLLKTKKFKAAHLLHVVIDEADTLLDDSFSHEIQFIINQLVVGGTSKTLEKPEEYEESSYTLSHEESHVPMQRPAGVQVSFVSATMPKTIDKIVGDLVDIHSFRKVTTKGLHRLMQHVSQKFYKATWTVKQEEILRLVRQGQEKKEVMMIFCNRSSTSFWLNKYLKENGINNSILNSVLTSEERDRLFENFQEGYTDILVCTDIASRGLDTVRVTHVINYEFPEFMSDYIHRAGRVGRVGSQKQGKVTSFITELWDVDLVWQIETSARKSAELHNVNANIRQKEQMKYERRLNSSEDIHDQGMELNMEKMYI